MLNEEIKKRNIPDVLKFFGGDTVVSSVDWQKRRAELRDYFQSEMYGYIPAAPDEVSFEEISRDELFSGGKLELYTVLIKPRVNGKIASFKVQCVLPRKRIKGAFIYADFFDTVPSKCLPAEEIADNGYAVFSFFYEDTSSDNNDFTNGLASLFFEKGERKESDAGKISIWAWAMMRVMDYVQTLDSIPKDRIILVGHSRLGKTALLAGAYDERFYGVVSNDSGCAGAAIERGKRGETYKDAFREFGHWFAPKFETYALGKRELLVDQHCLLVLTAPRKLYVASAILDKWADPDSELLACVAASPVFELLGKKGLSYSGEFLRKATALHSGDVAYHLRDGVHYLNRDDWNNFIKYFDKTFNH